MLCPKSPPLGRAEAYYDKFPCIAQRESLNDGFYILVETLLFAPYRRWKPSG